MRRIRPLLCGILVFTVVVAVAGAMALESLNRAIGNRRIDFYGAVIDDQGQPVSGATVKLIISRIPLMLTDHATRTVHVVVTDSSGAFFLKGENGEFLDIDSIEKRSTNQFGPIGKAREYYYGDNPGPNRTTFIPDPLHPIQLYLKTLSPERPLMSVPRDTVK